MVSLASNMTPFAQILSECREAPLVFDDVRPDLCADLEQIILGRMEHGRGRSAIGSLNVGGWKSGEDFFSWPYDAVQALRQAIMDQIAPPHVPVAWAMVNRGGSHHPRHQHRIASLSGVYYVNAGDPTHLTPTVFECPCDGRPRARKSELAVEPHPARLVMCRGETWHFVPKYMGELPRITIAFDVRR